MAEYLDNIFTDDDISSQEFIDAVSKDLADITGYEEPKSEKKEEERDPLLDVTEKEVVEITEIKKNIVDKLTNEEKQKILRKPRTKASIAVDEHNDILCKSWGNYYIEGGDYYEETVLIINDYFEECEKPVAERDFSKFIVGKKNIVEKFKDMNLHKGEFDVHGFYENVVK